jgi:hypothetical protein
MSPVCKFLVEAAFGQNCASNAIDRVWENKSKMLRGVAIAPSTVVSASSGAGQ